MALPGRAHLLQAAQGTGRLQFLEPRAFAEEGGWSLRCIEVYLNGACGCQPTKELSYLSFAVVACPREVAEPVASAMHRAEDGRVSPNLRLHGFMCVGALVGMVGLWKSMQR